MATPLPAGLHTDLEILRLQGGIVEDRGDHLVVRAPFNPDFHFGNYVVVTGGDPDDADHWVSVFRDAHPGARHLAIGLPRVPAQGTYEHLDLDLDVDEALVADALPEQRPLAPGYTVRTLDEDGWKQWVANACADNLRTSAQEPVGFERFQRAQVAARRALVERGAAQFFGAFAGDELASSLGIVVLGEHARYQPVETAMPHRRRGLAGHLLGVAAQWAHERGARRFVIVTEATNPAGRLYRSVGFAPTDAAVSLYRAPR